MPISFVGSKTFTHASTTAQSTSLTDLLNESDAAATLQDGDLLLLYYVNASTIATRTQVQMTPPFWTAAALGQNSDDTNDTNALLSYKFMVGTPDTTVTIPASNATTAGVAVVIHAFRGVDTVSPFGRFNFQTQLTQVSPMQGLSLQL